MTKDAAVRIASGQKTSGMSARRQTPGFFFKYAISAFSFPNTMKGIALCKTILDSMSVKEVLDIFTKSSVPLSDLSCFWIAL